FHAVIAHCFNHYASIGAAWVFQNCLHKFTYISLILLKIIPLLLYSITCQSHNRHVQVISIPFYFRYLFFTFISSKFGDSQQLRLVRILRSTVMVRVGGGWMALDEFLVKNDPCRAKGRTNVELREKFMLPEGISQSMTPFRPKGRRSRPSSRGASPNRSNSSPNIQASPSQITGTSTPKGTPIQGSKLRLPGYLSGKGFHSTEESSLLTAASTKVKAQFADYRKTPSRAGSKAGSRSSSRRGSDASDFDISDIQSVCSDMSETVHDSRPSPRSSSRLSTGKPSKIPTPQRRSPLSKLATTKAAKR
ncbi:hypothetical protein AB205_0115560, partial [Aquarana catesbeiana]